MFNKDELDHLKLKLEQFTQPDHPQKPDLYRRKRSPKIVKKSYTDLITIFDNNDLTLQTNFNTKIKNSVGP